VFSALCARKSHDQFATPRLYNSVSTVPPRWHSLVECAAIDALKDREFPGRFIAFATNQSLFINFFLRSPHSSLISFFDHLTRP
jgi:hypothetical protein